MKWCCASTVAMLPVSLIIAWWHTSIHHTFACLVAPGLPGCGILYADLLQQPQEEHTPNETVDALAELLRIQRHVHWVVLLLTIVAVTDSTYTWSMKVMNALRAPQ